MQILTETSYYNLWLDKYNNLSSVIVKVAWKQQNHKKCKNKMNENRNRKIKSHLTLYSRYYDYTDNVCNIDSTHSTFE